MADPPAPSFASLDYAKAPSRKRRIFQPAMWVVLIAAVFFAGYRWGSQALQQTQLLYWQRQCLSYAPPADMVVYESEPSAVATLVAKDSRYTKTVLAPIIQLSTSLTSVTCASYVPDCWTKLVAHLA